MTNRGVDVASYQGRIDFDALKNDVSFVIAKATEGTGYLDSTFDRNWTEAKRVGLIAGAYHFARPDLGLKAGEEATYFLSALGTLEGSELLALDYEVNWDGAVVPWCKEFLDEVRLATGIVPYIYLNMSLVRRHNWSSVIAAGYPLWLAYYDEQPDIVPQTPWPTVAIKQWTSSGALAGIKGRVDVNTRFEEADVTPEEAKQIAEKALADAGLDPNTVETFKTHLDEHIHPPTLSKPLSPPVRGAELNSASADWKQIVWMYPDGSHHTFIDGKEVTP